RAAFENAILVNAAIGGSTNAVLHLLAIAGRLGVPLDLEDFDRLGARLPLLVDLMPSGRFLMEQFAYAGGLPALVERIREHLNADVVTVTGRSLLDNCAGAVVHDDEVIRPLANPVQPAGSGTAVLRGNLAPRGAVVKQSAAEPRLLSHTGPALVFDSVEDYHAVIDDPDLPVTADTVLVVRNTGPVGYPGMPEVGNLALPRKLLDAGIRDLVRISDARMSGTAFGACVLHVAPEAAVGGPLALVRTGDLITVDTPGRRLHLHVDDEELATRRAAWQPPPSTDRGWVRLYREHVQQADRGVDLDFLVGATDSTPPRAAF
ncbi:dihydroxy-acid dehydratase, partial [Crossiella equi]